MSADKDKRRRELFGLLGDLPDRAAEISAKPVGQERRGGYVLPASPSKRAAFRLLRRVFGDRGRVAAWTRTWSGPWLVQMSPTGDVLGPFANRDAAVRAEVRYLEETND